MKNKLFIFFAIVGLLSVLSGCEKDEDKVVILANPTAPSLNALPGLTLERNNATQTLTFTGTAVDPGFDASATYFLEASVAGTGFAAPVSLYSGVSVNSIEMTVAELNSKLLAILPADQTTSVDFRIRSILTLDAGTGAPGSVGNELEYISDVKTADVMVYGLPRLDLTGTGMEQKIESPNGDGVYSGYVKVDPASPFTLLDPDASVTYGGAADALSVDGGGIVADAAGWHWMTANTNDMTYSLEAFMIGLVGSATPNGWDSPDQKMDYNPETGTWDITIDLVDGDIKFRLNDGWAWNLGGTTDNLVHNGDNITVTAGNYSISLTITEITAGSEAGTYTITKNS